ncbi:GTPase Era [Candidatus Tokpelaia sp.]|uniref:GTPase Era n=1 Tax=Candidatus Tokpelaia sp. TaxID=2233777 RepID=UPI0012393423|nr:GTPase Era [Candidatus Tokpelaia sp.]KAA6405514.1 GTPase Era [Candidatus Tokpelaia sp.]
MAVAPEKEQNAVAKVEKAARPQNNAPEQRQSRGNRGGQGEEEPPGEKLSRSGFVALIGAPNAGKSTFINRLVGAKISIVTHKAQTTRALVRGIIRQGNTQIVFVDSPGIFVPKKPLDKAMVAAAWSGAREADIVLLVVDAKEGFSTRLEPLVAYMQQCRQPKILVLNKIDKVRPEDLLALAAQFNAAVPFDRVFMVSALNGSGCADVTLWLSAHLPPGPFYYPEDQLSDMPLRRLAAEITREKLILRLHDELPYAATVETEKWQERQDGSVKIDQICYVERESHRKILLGAKGATIKAIGQAARKEIAAVLEQKVHLFLFVKVRPNWSKKAGHYREMGLDSTD